jgi:diketogulonate reductase-like aldo/keto reductase
MRFLTREGRSVIPRATRGERLKENLAIVQSPTMEEAGEPKAIT